MASEAEETVRRRVAVTEYRRKLLQHKELDSRVRAVRENLRTMKKDFSKTEDDLKSLQCVGQIIGEVLRHLDDERLIVKASSGPRYVVGCRNKVDKEKLTAGTRVVLDMTTLTICPVKLIQLYIIYFMKTLAMLVTLQLEGFQTRFGSLGNQ